MTHHLDAPLSKLTRWAHGDDLAAPRAAKDRTRAKLDAETLARIEAAEAELAQWKKEFGFGSLPVPPPQPPPLTEDDVRLIVLEMLVAIGIWRAS